MPPSDKKLIGWDVVGRLEAKKTTYLQARPCSKCAAPTKNNITTEPSAFCLQARAYVDSFILIVLEIMYIMFF